MRDHASFCLLTQVVVCSNVSPHNQSSGSITHAHAFVTGLVKLNSPALLSGETNWQYRHCAIRNGVFECFKDDSTSSDLEFSLLLTDYELLAHAPEKDSLSLTVTRQGEVAFIIEV